MSAERMQNRLVELSPESDVTPSVQRGRYAFGSLMHLFSG